MVNGNYSFKALIILALVAPGLNVWADFAGGVAAYKQRDYARAQVLFAALAEAGDARAQFALGLLYDNGEGLAHDDQRASNGIARAPPRATPKPSTTSL